MELKETVELMNSNDYKERFKAEYYQTKIRYNKLHNMIIKYEANALEFELNCDIEIYKKQAKAMGEYLYCLEIRAVVEKIVL